MVHRLIGHPLAAIYEIRLEKARHGTVTRDDVTVKFPQGTQVNDMIEGRQYVYGEVPRSKRPLLYFGIGLLILAAVLLGGGWSRD